MAVSVSLGLLSGCSSADPDRLNEIIERKSQASSENGAATNGESADAGRESASGASTGGRSRDAGPGDTASSNSDEFGRTTTGGAQADAGPPCGDGRVGAGEKCDVGIAAGEPGACPTQCDAPDPCLPFELRGSECLAECVAVQLECTNGDGCCPAGCSNPEDDDCSAACGDGVVQKDQGELCEVAGRDGGVPAPELACPSECPDDGDACTVEALIGSADNCNSKCTLATIVALDDGDGCCPAGASSLDDADCPVVCGNSVVEAGEACDGQANCDAQCNWLIPADQRRCLDVFTQSSASCESCMCESCTSAVNDCFDSGDAQRDADCAELVYCGLENNCRGATCYCGFDTPPDGTCLVGNGPCAELMDQIAASPGALSVYNEQFDTSTAIGRAKFFTECHGSQCPDDCP